jgi:DNA repair photolyase
VAAPPDLRWQLADDGPADPQGALFDDVVERHIGRGEYRGMEFLHVNARRVINEVPAASRLPFRYTINAYRGCSHACTYCLAPDTPILLAEGRTRRIADLRVGDTVVGTERIGRYRRFVATPVLAHWWTVKPAFRITLADGTKLVASGDHRFLTERGWKHVTGSEQGQDRRPHLTIGDALLGIGRLPEPPTREPHYERGYLCGMVRSDWIEVAFRQLGVRSVRDPARANGVCTVRLVGGLGEIVRFVLMVDPATARKRSILGRALEDGRARRVVSIEPLRVEIPMFDITTGTGDFISDGVISHNCFARPTHEYLGMNAGEDFERRIVVKVNAVERLRAELAPSRWAGDHIAMGTNTDPYQRCEAKYRLTKGIVRELAAAANPFSILTKSTLILRDLDLLAEAARATDVRANFSIGTLDEEVWRLTEPGTPHPRQRVEAVAKLNAAGVPCGVLVAPVLPGLSDRDDQLEAVVKACVEAGAVTIAPLLLHLRPGVREHYLGWLAGARPDLLYRHEELYPKAYAPKAAQEALSRRVSRLVERHGGRTVAPSETRTRPNAAKPARRPQPPAARQLALDV